MRQSQIPLLLLVIFIGPLLGIWLSGESILPYLHYPPRSTQVTPEKVSWTLFVGGIIFLVLCSTPFLIRLLTFPRTSITGCTKNSFPTWGWMALTSLMLFWIIAWSRFTWLDSFQLHTFTPLWLSYILLVSACTTRQTGRCLLLNETKYFLFLFPVSAGFWWIFEYLNRFGHNWYYLPVNEFDALHYFLFGSLCFSTVLPAIYVTYEFLKTFPIINDPFKAWRRVNVGQGKGLGWLVLVTATLGLVGIGMWPTRLYPLIWISPLLLLLGIQILQSHASFLEKLRKGDWRLVITPALAGLICGFFWELWNSQSLAHWEYSIPYLQVFHIFEMPILGYAGYIPFSITCLLVIEIFLPPKT
mgnify:CR=1 FL=1